MAGSQPSPQCLSRARERVATWRRGIAALAGYRNGNLNPGGIGVPTMGADRAYWISVG